MSIFFTSAEAAAWLAEQSGDKCTPLDVRRLAELGEIPVCFRYQGLVGVFPHRSPADVLDFGDRDGPAYRPIPDRRGYFDGYLRALNPPRLGQSMTLDGRRHKVDCLEPSAVVPAEASRCDPAWHVLTDVDGYVAPLADDLTPACLIVPASAWLFHVDDLRDVRRRQRAREAEAAKVEIAAKLSAAGRKGGLVKPAPGRDEQIYRDYLAMVAAGHAAPTHALGIRYGLTDSRIRQILRPQRKKVEI